MGGAHTNSLGFEQGCKTDGFRAKMRSVFNESMLLTFNFDIKQPFLLAEKKHDMSFMYEKG